MFEKYVEDLRGGAGSSSSSSSSSAPTTHVERAFAEALADVTGADRVSVDSHFFEELGADSMVMARFCARVRKRGDVPSVSMKDVYRNSTIRSLAAALTDGAPAVEELPLVEVGQRASGRRYVLCGALQALFYLVFAYLAAIVLDSGFFWISAASGLLDVYVRSVEFGAAVFGGACVLPIVAKWVLVGRWKRQQIPLWSLAYVRFWVVKTLARLNPLAFFTGSPLYLMYLRAMGARIGRGAVIFSRHLPVCTDLLTVGAGAVIRKDAFFMGYRARAGMIETGAVTVGRDAFVGEASVLDVDTSVGDDAQLGHSSSLHTGQAVPAGERWHGSPAQPSGVEYQTVPPARCGSLRRARYAIVQLLVALLVVSPLVVGGVVMLLVEVPRLATLLDPGQFDLMSWLLYVEVLVGSLVLFIGLALVGLLWAATVPRLLGLVVKPGRVYRLYGMRYRIHRSMARMTNIPFFTELFGDSSAVVPYLQGIGYRLSPVVQTGSNFGQTVKHESPLAANVGPGTMIADGLSIVNADFSATSFRVSEASIGANNFLGNWIVYPAQSRTGDNCLLATKVLVPTDGPVRENVGLLGSPPFEIPRSVQRDTQFDHLRVGEEFRRRLAAKNRHNAISAAWYLLVRWLYFFVIAMIYVLVVDVYHNVGEFAVALATVVALVFTVGYFALIERASTGFRPLRPLYCSIYDVRFWRHERFWKSMVLSYQHIFDGTPFKGLVWRLLGVRIGRRVFDDGCLIAEKTLVSIGDDTMLNAGSRIQCHSQEDGAFKSEHITIGAGVTIGVNALVHYGVNVGDGAVLAADSFLMKGEEVAPRTYWGGNPAKRMREVSAAVPAPRTSAVNGADGDPATGGARGLAAVDGRTR